MLRLIWIGLGSSGLVELETHERRLHETGRPAGVGGPHARGDEVVRERREPDLVGLPDDRANGSAPSTPSAAASTYSRPQRACSGVLTAPHRSMHRLRARRATARSARISRTDRSFETRSTVATRSFLSLKW